MHGHTHDSFDYVVPGSRTRVVCNPRGYVRELFDGRIRENAMYDECKVVEI